MQCAYHPDREPIGACVSCGRLICIECKTMLGGKIYCSQCADSLFVNKTQPAAHEPARSATPTPPPPAAAPASPHAAAPPPPPQAAPAAPAPVIVNVNTAPAAPASVNNSGQGGGTTLPGEIRGWSWGGFMFSWLWGIFNGAWLTFLVLIVPFWSFVIGAKGKQWAWQNKKWDSIEHFKSTQHTWDLWGKILFFVWLAGMIIWGVILLVMLIIAISSGGSLSFD
jgi:hypothetical protein